MRIVQLMNCDNEHAGLYETKRDDVENFQADFDLAIQVAVKKEEEQDIEDECMSVQEFMDGVLNEKDFFRIWAEEVTTNEF